MKRTLADPTHKRESLRIVLPGRLFHPEARYLPATGQTEVRISLPREGAAGSAVRLELRRKSKGD